MIDTTVERTGLVVRVEHRRTRRCAPWIRLTVRHTGALETPVLVVPARRGLALHVVEGDTIRVSGTLLDAVDPLAPRAIVAESLRVLTPVDGGDPR